VASDCSDGCARTGLLFGDASLPGESNVVESSIAKRRAFDAKEVIGGREVRGLLVVVDVAAPSRTRKTCRGDVASARMAISQNPDATNVAKMMKFDVDRSRFGEILARQERGQGLSP
jgi:hypothetical protein